MSSAQTFIDILNELEVSGDEKGFTFVEPSGKERFVGWQTLLAEARARGRKLASLGLQPGDRVALVLPQPYEFVMTFLGAVTAGIVPVPLYPPLALARLDAYLDGTARVLNAAGAQLLVTTSAMEKILWSLVPRAPTLRDLVTVEKLVASGSDVADARPPHRALPGDPVFLQFTSGSTAAPKGVVVTHASLVANTRGIIYDGLAADPKIDVGVSWLPLYHDMGLIGFVLAPLVAKIPIVFIPTLDFVKRPILWMDIVHKHRGTLTFAPNFAFARLTKRATDADLGRWDLSCLRVVGCGAEPIHAPTMRAFVDKMARAKFRPEALLPCYGMAEATLAMSFVDLRSTLRVDEIDADVCYEERRARPKAKGGLELVSCGKPFPGHEIGIFSDDGKKLGERMIGEIRYRGPSVAGGYYKNPEATKAAFLADGWLRTGDLGYLADGELYISGRQKDILIIHGRNYYPQAIEWQIEEVAGVRKGNVVVFSVPGPDTEEIVVVGETAELDPEKRRALAHQVKSHLSATTSLAARDVVLLGVGELPKTTSGKVQRRKTREQYLARTLGTEGVRTLGSAGERILIARHFMLSLASRIGHRASTIWPWWPMTVVQKRRARRAEGN